MTYWSGAIQTCAFVERKNAKESGTAYFLAYLATVLLFSWVPNECKTLRPGGILSAAEEFSNRPSSLFRANPGKWNFQIP
jgi:hypothetical protein